MSSTVLHRPAGIAHEPSGADIWNAIVQATIGCYRTMAFHEVTLEVVAEASGLGLDTVLERFPSHDDLVVATVQVWNAERMAIAVPLAERHGAVAFLRILAQANVEDPSLVRLLIAVVNIAATPDHPMAGALQRQWKQFRALVERSLARDVALRREPELLDPVRGAEQLIALHEGLNIQSMMRPGMDALEAFDLAVERLRVGWSHPPALVWEL